MSIKLKIRDPKYAIFSLLQGLHPPLPFLERHHPFSKFFGSTAAKLYDPRAYGSVSILPTRPGKTDEQTDRQTDDAFP
jgi:hypothetical protein